MFAVLHFFQFFQFLPDKILICKGLFKDRSYSIETVESWEQQGAFSGNEFILTQIFFIFSSSLYDTCVDTYNLSENL